MTSHALLSASSSHRWLTCTPAPRLEATLPEPPRRTGQKDFSGEGTLAHSLSEIKLKYQLDQIGSEEYDTEYELIKQNPLYSEELEEVADSYTNYVRSQIGAGDRVIIEARVDLSEYIPEGFGTADCIILSKTKLTTIDLKAGAGIPVSAVNNPQLRLYSLGAYERYKEEFPNLKEIKTIIVQPRLGSITVDHTTVAKLTEWGKYFVAPKAKKAWAGTGDFIPGDHCQFCRAKAQCRARSDFNNEVAALDFRPAPLLSEEEFDLVLSRVGDLKTWASDVEEFANQRAINENIIPIGYKLYTPKGNRKISDADLAATVLTEKLNIDKADLYEVKFKSVAQLEKLGQKGQVAATLGALILRPDGTPRLVKDETLKADFA
jgi:hypothetical protein